MRLAIIAVLAAAGVGCTAAPPVQHDAKHDAKHEPSGASPAEVELRRACMLALERLGISPIYSSMSVAIVSVAIGVGSNTGRAVCSVSVPAGKAASAGEGTYTVTLRTADLYVLTVDKKTGEQEQRLYAGPDQGS